MEIDVEWYGILAVSAAQDILSLKDIPTTQQCALAFRGHTRHRALDTVTLSPLARIVQAGFTIVTQSPHAVISVQNTLQILGLPYLGNVDFPAAYRAAIAGDTGARKRTSAVDELVECYNAAKRRTLPGAPLPYAPIRVNNGKLGFESLGGNNCGDGGVVGYYDSLRQHRLLIADDDDDDSSTASSSGSSASCASATLSIESLD
jgi:hypothetical protein